MIILFEVKKQIAFMQESGKYNDLIHYLLELAQSTDSCDILTLCIAELYWIIEERYYFNDCPSESPKGYSEIIWDFLDTFAALVRKELDNHNDNMFFQFHIGYLLAVNPVPFADVNSFLYLEAKANEMLCRASELSIGTEIHELVKCVAYDEVKSPTYRTKKARIMKQLKLMDFGPNYADQNLEYQLVHLLDN